MIPELLHPFAPAFITIGTIGTIGAVASLVTLRTLRWLGGAVLASSLALFATGCATWHVRPAAESIESGSDLAAVSAKLTSNFHNLHVDEVRKSELPGLYEVYLPGRVVYYAPEQNLLLFGEFYGVDGKSVTAGKVLAEQVAKAGQLNLDASVVVGDGPIDLVSFVDPQCGYCRAAHEWIKKNGLEARIREHVMFMPLTGRPEAQALAASVVCAPPALKRQALDQMWSGVTDKSLLLSCPQAEQQLTAQADQAVRFGVGGTPTWVVAGQVLTGFHPDQLSTLLAAK